MNKVEFRKAVAERNAMLKHQTMLDIEKKLYENDVDLVQLVNLLIEEFAKNPRVSVHLNEFSFYPIKDDPHENFEFMMLLSHWLDLSLGLDLDYKRIDSSLRNYFVRIRKEE